MAKIELKNIDYNNSRISLHVEFTEQEQHDYKLPITSEEKKSVLDLVTPFDFTPYRIISESHEIYNKDGEKVLDENGQPLQYTVNKNEQRDLPKEIMEYAQKIVKDYMEQIKANALPDELAEIIGKKVTLK
jgi:hypothetical protein